MTPTSISLDQIYDNLVAQISYRSGSSTIKVDFDWQQNSLIKQYVWTKNDGTVWTTEEYALYSFAYGKIVEDGHGGGGIQEVFALNFTSVGCFLFVFYPQS